MVDLDMWNIIHKKACWPASSALANETKALARFIHLGKCSTKTPLHTLLACSPTCTCKLLVTHLQLAPPQHVNGSAIDIY